MSMRTFVISAVRARLSLLARANLCRPRAEIGPRAEIVACACLIAHILMHAHTHECRRARARLDSARLETPQYHSITTLQDKDLWRGRGKSAAGASD